MTVLPLHREAGGVTWSITPKSWEIDFFDRHVASLQWTIEDPAVGPAERLAALRHVVVHADNNGVDLLETHLDAAEFHLAPLLEEVGFRLVDSRIRFLSRMTVDEIPSVAPRRGQVVDARPEDLDRILELTHLSLTDNDQFVSRFKNRTYFTHEDSRRYFAAWANNTVFSDDARAAVYVIDERVVGFYIYQVTEHINGAPVLKGILTGVEPSARGNRAQLAMQSHLYREFGFEEWYLDNLTQLTNLTVIRNHIRSAKNLESIHLTYYRLAGPRG